MKILNMKIRVNKVHKHFCYQCKRKVSCWYTHREDGSDLIGSLCDYCVDQAMRELEKENKRGIN